MIKHVDQQEYRVRLYYRGNDAEWRWTVTVDVIANTPEKAIAMAKTFYAVKLDGTSSSEHRWKGRIEKTTVRGVLIEA